MKKKILLLLLLLVLPFNGYALEYPELHYENAIVYDLTESKVLYELKSDERKSIASLTKIMTIITAIENNQDFTKKITYSQSMKNNVAWYASVAGFKVGDVLTFNDLLYGAMLPSGADATVALAITTSGSLNNFVIEMNKLAKKIGMTNSHFENVHGLDEDNHYSTVGDIQKLLEYALKNEKFKEIYTTKEYTLSTGRTIKSTTKKQADAYGIDINKIRGSKTGFTGNAGLCISVLMEHKEHQIIFITLNAPERKQGLSYNLSDALELINFIEENYDNQILSRTGEVIKELPIKNSKQETFAIKNQKDIKEFLPNDYDKDKFKVKYTGKKELSYKDKKGTTIGKVKYYFDNELLAEEDIKVDIEIEISILKIIQSNIVLIITIVLSFLFGIFLFKGRNRIKRKILRKIR